MSAEQTSSVRLQVRTLPASVSVLTRTKGLAPPTEKRGRDRNKAKAAADATSSWKDRPEGAPASADGGRLLVTDLMFVMLMLLLSIPNWNPCDPQVASSFLHHSSARPTPSETV